MESVLNAVDWVSLKLNGLVIPFLFINPNPFMLWLGAMATLSTIVYNGIRIYKELKAKK